MVKPYLWHLLSIKHIRKRFKPEAKIQYEFVSNLRTLSLEGKLRCIWFAISNETGRNDQATFGQTQKMLGKISGTPDLAFMWKGGCGFIEFKAPGGTQTVNQKYFQEWCKEQNVEYRLCHSSGEALAVLLEWEVIDEQENQRSWIKFDQKI